MPLYRAWRLCANRFHVIGQLKLVCAQFEERKNEKDQGPLWQGDVGCKCVEPYYVANIVDLKDTHYNSCH